MAKIIYESELYHHGIIGQKWGVRRYQNKDGSLTKIGQKRLRQELDNEQKYLDANNKLPKNSIGKRIIANSSELKKTGKELGKYEKIRKEYEKKTGNDEDMFDIYLKSLGIDSNKYISNWKKADDKQYAAVQHEINKILGKYANKSYDFRHDPNTQLMVSINKALEDEYVNK